MCWLERLDPATENREDLSIFRAEAWTDNPATIPAEVIYKVEEPLPPREDADDPILGHLPLELGEKATLRSISKAGHLVHLERPCVYNRILMEFLQPHCGCV
uniref:AB hydrolase-1 domain-containing protein n=1 Tax=Leersia perrieri TaxID=77586 RepID=A0A0D9WK97_9ORYZ